jgi:hypothetical protein
MADKFTEPSPATIGRLRAHGLKRVCPNCLFCGRSGVVDFDRIALAEKTPFPDIGRARLFRCFARGARLAHACQKSKWG